jgi:hypothetical protein
MSIYKNYTNLISSEENILDFFKSHPTYNGILEHVNERQGLEYYEYIKKSKIWIDGKIDTKIIYEIVKENDKLGNPHKFEYDFGKCSPTSLRYIYHAILILEEIKSEKNINIVEVGGGYGGLCLILERLSKFYDLKIDKYLIVDLPDVLMLQKKYLDRFELNFEVEFHSAELFGSTIVENNLYLVSNYCLGEIGEELVSQYHTKLFPKVYRGFMTWNCEIVWNCVSRFFEIEIDQEKPLTYWFNKYIRIIRQK